MEQIKQLWKGIAEPSREFTPVPFWFFNDEPDEIKIRRQLEDFAEKGVHAFVLHPRIGIPEEISYLSPTYFEVIRFVIKTASEIGMKVVLYDEGMYPSGSAHGMVVNENSEFASKGIILSEEAAGGEVLAEMPDGRFLVYGFTGGTIRGIHFGEDDGEEGAPKSADILNPEAVKTFIHLTHDKYYEELKDYFGTVVIGFFTDEPCALGRNAAGFREWVRGLETEIRAEGGELTELGALFEEKENKTTRIYRKLIKRHLRETFYKPLSEWCTEHDIVLMGHPAESDDIEEEMYFHVPGQDLILRRVEPMTGGLSGRDSVQAKLTADIARLTGCRRNMNECFGVCGRDHIPWYFTGRDMKWYIDWLGIRGVNLFVPHAFYYSLAGKRKDERPPDVGPGNIWWPHYRRFSDYIKRISWLMTDSKDHSAVAVLCDNNHVPSEEIEKLYENQIGFHYLPVSLLEGGREEDGRLHIGDCCYEAVLNVLGEDYGALSGLTGIRTASSAEEILELAAQERCRMLKTVITEPSADDLRAVWRNKGGCDFILLFNEGSKPIRVRLSAADLLLPVWIDLWEGEAYECSLVNDSGGTSWIEAVLDPCETALLVSDPDGDLTEILCRRAKAADWTDWFQLQTRDTNRRIYKCLVDTDEMEVMPERIQVSGEEMAECYCNGQLAGVSFWSPHVFKIGPMLKEGKNEIEVIMTGNAANLYTEEEISFGLTKITEIENCDEI